MFKKGILFLVALFVGTLLIINSVFATTLSVNPSSLDVFPGDSFDISIGISGLGDYSPDSLSMFDLDLSFDAGILSFDSATFGDPILGDQLSLSWFESLTSVTPSIGTVNLSQLSFDFPEDLNTLQAGSFTLATLNFDTLAVGTSPLNLSINTLEDAWGESVTIDEIERGTIKVVPAPSSIMLLLFGLLGTVGIKKRFC